jgi:hypothetical protein
MKTAVLISGQARCVKDNFENFKRQIADIYVPDIFISTWFPQGEPIIASSKDVVAEDVSAQEISDLFKPKILELERYDKQIVDLLNCKAGQYNMVHYDTNIYNFIAQYYKKKRVSQLIDVSEYDFAIYYRFDLSTKGLIVPYPDRLCMPLGNNCRGGIGDIMAYGKPQYVVDFLRLYDYIGQCYNEIGFIHPESCLRHYLTRIKNLTIYRTSLQCYIRGSKYNNLNKEEHFDDYDYPHPDELAYLV